MLSNWDDIRCFVAVVRAGSLTGAAEKLAMSQPSVGRRLNALEKALDSKLLRRVSGRYELTPFGERVFAHACEMEQAALAVAGANRGADPSRAVPGRVCLTTTECIASTWLVEQMASLRRDSSGVDLELRTGLSQAQFSNREADIALRVGARGDEALDAVHCGTINFALYASEAYLNQRGVPSTCAELRHHAVLESLQELSGVVQARALRSLAPQESKTFAFNSILAQLEACAFGLGIAALPRYLSCRKPQLRRILEFEFDIELDFWVLTHPESREDLQIVQLVKLLREAIARDRTSFCSPG